MHEAKTGQAALGNLHECRICPKANEGETKKLTHTLPHYSL